MRSTKRWLFRVIVISLIISIFTDIIWMIFNTSSWWSRAPYDGDVELVLRRFVIIVTFVSFLFRIPVFLVMWKISVDFDRLFRARHESNDSSSLIAGDHYIN